MKSTIVLIFTILLLFGLLNSVAYSNSYRVSGNSVSKVIYAKNKRIIGEIALTRAKFWLERIYGKKKTYRFLETHRNANSIILYDRSRNVYLLIDLHNRTVSACWGRRGRYNYLYDINRMVGSVVRKKVRSKVVVSHRPARGVNRNKARPVHRARPVNTAQIKIIKAKD